MKTCPNGHPADGDICVSYKCERTKPSAITKEKAAAKDVGASSTNTPCGVCEECNIGIRCREVSGLLQYDDGTYLLLSEEGEVLAVSGNSEFDDIGKAPTEHGVIVHILGEYFPCNRDEE